MIEVESTLREWGRSIGVVVPKEAIEKEHMKKGDTVKLLIVRKTNALRDTFGTFRFKKSTDQMLKEIDEEGWDE